MKFLSVNRTVDKTVIAIFWIRDTFHARRQTSKSARQVVDLAAVINLNWCHVGMFVNEEENLNIDEKYKSIEMCASVPAAARWGLMHLSVY